MSAPRALAAAHRIWEFSTMKLCERRFAVEQIDMRGPAGLEQVDDALSGRLMMRQSGRRLRSGQSHKGQSAHAASDKAAS